MDLSSRDWFEWVQGVTGTARNVVQVATGVGLGGAAVSLVARLRSHGAVDAVCEQTHLINHHYRERLGWVVYMKRTGGQGQIRGGQESGVTESSPPPLLQDPEDVPRLMVGDLERVCGHIASAVSRLHGSTVTASVYLIAMEDPKQGERSCEMVALAASSDNARREQATGQRFAVGKETNSAFHALKQDGVLNLTYCEVCPITASTTSSLPGWGNQYKSALTFPVRFSHIGHQIGFLVLDSAKSKPFSPAVKRLAAAFSDQLYNYHNLIVHFWALGVLGRRKEN